LVVLLVGADVVFVGFLAAAVLLVVVVTLVAVVFVEVLFVVVLFVVVLLVVVLFTEVLFARVLCVTLFVVVDVAGFGVAFAAGAAGSAARAVATGGAALGAGGAGASALAAASVVGSATGWAFLEGGTEDPPGSAEAADTCCFVSLERDKAHAAPKARINAIAAPPRPNAARRSRPQGKAGVRSGGGGTEAPMGSMSAIDLRVVGLSR
jgi:hypothetical protein